METTDLGSGKRQTTDVDQVIGARLRSLRLQAGWSQQELAVKLNVSFQQVQKYERAMNRLSAATLSKAATIFDVPMEFFFDDVAAGAPSQGEAVDQTVDNRLEARLLTRYRRASPKLRPSLLGLLQAAIPLQDDIEEN